MSLFPELDVTPLERVVVKLSADRARTERRKAMLARGLHPTGLGMVNHAHKCGECVHCVSHRGNKKTFHKCDLLEITLGPGTDIRLSWPSCPKFAPIGQP